MTTMSLFYTVQKGDTLSKIAKQNATSVEDLCRINGIQNPDRIDIGQIIALRDEAVLNVGVQLLDREWNPIPSVDILYDYGGKQEKHSSGSNGRVPDIQTNSPEDIVKIFIARADGTWKQIAQVTSDWGNKLVTLISPKYRIPAKTQSHPKDKNGRPVADKPASERKPVSRPDHPKDSTGKGQSHSDYGDGKGTKSEDGKAENGAPVKKVTKDQAALEFLTKGYYTGEKISEEDYKKAAKSIGCEVAVIKAVAEVESKKISFNEKNWPIILYERHKFSINTEPIGKYNKTNPDISSEKPYQSASPDNKKLVKEGRLAAGDIYGNSYTRLAKAYSLDKNAALMACSWGKFQILGENYKSAGFKSVLSFVETMCISEKEHLKAFVNFVNADRVKKNAAINKDWRTFARAYNGKGYKKFKYDTKMKEAYKRYAK